MITKLKPVDQVINDVQGTLATYSDDVVQEKVNNLFSSWREFYENVEPTGDVLIVLPISGQFIIDNSELERLAVTVTDQGRLFSVQTL